MVLDLLAVHVAVPPHRIQLLHERLQLLRAAGYGIVHTLYDQRSVTTASATTLYLVKKVVARNLVHTHLPPSLYIYIYT